MHHDNRAPSYRYLLFFCEAAYLGWVQVGGRPSVLMVNDFSGRTLGELAADKLRIEKALCLLHSCRMKKDVNMFDYEIYHASYGLMLAYIDKQVHLQKLEQISLSHGCKA